MAHSLGELGVATAFFLHAIASSPAFIYANQTAYTFIADDILKGGMLRFVNGHLPVPREPGSGVELDGGKIKKYAMLYERDVRGRDLTSQPSRRMAEPRADSANLIPMPARY